ncbi:14976_t:CDS:2 [Acaulospora morrowiae]|uniref:14976_t:CDS:1 n=1 Tax=Acaulospora morrowiae TaxID=94023 RepID=A0A9N8VAQ2_9GLOM|nr:14976_t:CDS:2 [Acaulospora morrowiae]
MAIHRNIAYKNRYVKQKLNDWRKQNGILEAEQLLKDINGINNTTQVKTKDLEIPRKALHSSIGFITLYLYPTTDPILVRNSLLVVFTIVLTADLLRFNNATFNELYIKVMGFLMREKEKKHKINGVVFYLAGCIGVLSIFPKDIAAMSILILSWCDTAASFFGRKYGHYTYRFSNGKSLAGTLGAIAIGSLAALMFWGVVTRQDQSNLTINERSWIPERSAFPLLLLALLNGIIGGVSELIDLWELDDNLVIPLAAGSFLWMLLRGLGLGIGESWISSFL